ncbi:MAG: helix-turn-helix domain-containing protein [Methylocella sp.]
MTHAFAHYKAAPAPQPGVLAVEETAFYLRISKAGVWRLLRDGKLPRTRIGGRTLIRKVDVDAFLAKCAGASS